MSENSEFDPPLGASAGSDPFAAAKASAKKAAEELKAAATAKAQEIRQAAEQRAKEIRSTAEERAAEFRTYADKTWQEARRDFRDISAEAEKFAREKPLQALLTAFGVGILVGIIIRR
jgi:ElaB/YqjD/DUF883 family membrane-anchored ribosome-binding protein